MQKEKQEQAGGTTRRAFLKTAGAVAAGALVTDWARSPVFAVAPPRVIGANDRINFGIIGCGGMGMTHVGSLMDQAEKGESNLKIVAVCDIYRPRKEQAQARTGGKLYHDYRKLLEDPDVDVVLIATPEHWHAQMAVDAMEAGKDVYLEKPMTRYLDEAKQVHEAVRRTKRVLQVGSQGCSEPKWGRAHELLPKVGKVLWSQTSYCRNTPEGEWNYYTIEEIKNPDDLDWKAFLGPAPKRPFDPQRFFRWRKYWDYSSGVAGDLYPHKIHPLMIVLGAELPVRVASTGGLYLQKERVEGSTGGCWIPKEGEERPADLKLVPDREVPDVVHMLADFPSGHTLLVAGCTANEQGLPTTVRGNKGTMYLEGNQVIIRPERPYAEELEEVREPVQSVDFMRDHEKNFMECVRTRGVPNCGPDLAYATMVTVALSEISYRKNKMVLFDPEKQRIVG